MPGTTVTVACKHVVLTIHRQGLALAFLWSDVYRKYFKNTTHLLTVKRDMSDKFARLLQRPWIKITSVEEERNAETWALPCFLWHHRLSSNQRLPNWLVRTSARIWQPWKLWQPIIKHEAISSKFTMEKNLKKSSQDSCVTIHITSNTFNAVFFLVSGVVSAFLFTNFGTVFLSQKYTSGTTDFELSTLPNTELQKFDYGMRNWPVSSRHKPTVASTGKCSTPTQ